jgi:SMC interacting uncharacterized protein involved in chromosome segregation
MDMERRQSDFETRLKVELVAKAMEDLSHHLKSHMEHEEDERSEMNKRLEKLEGKLTKVAGMCIFILGTIGGTETVKIMLGAGGL